MAFEYYIIVTGIDIYYPNAGNNNT